MFQVTFLSFIKSRSLKIRSHTPSVVGPGKEDLTSTLGSQQLDHVATIGSSFLAVVLLQIKLLVFDLRHLLLNLVGGCSRGIPREAISSIVYNSS